MSPITLRRCYWDVFGGADALGIYGRAYQLINISTDSLNSATGQVALSALSRIKDDPDRLKNYFLKGYSLVVALTLPITITCLLFADDLILIVLGSKWSEVTPIFRLLAPTTLVYALINPFSWLLFALGLVGRSLKIALVLAPLVIAGYVAGLPYGPQGVALAYSTVLALWVIPHLAWCVHGTNISLKDIMVVLSRPVLSVIVAGMLAWGVIAFCGDSFSHLAKTSSRVDGSSDCLHRPALLRHEAEGLVSGPRIGSSSRRRRQSGAVVLG